MSMQILTTIAETQKQINNWRKNGYTTALVPTMGNLHEGHLALVKAAQQKADKVIVSIFVNPTQFGPNEDFSAYPRTETQDQDKLNRIGTDCLFLPDVHEMYDRNAATRIEVTGLSDLHCGKTRPGHFSGVATIVCKLFNIMPADMALFGRKDYQQLAVIKKMVKDLNQPIIINSVDTVREHDGLAMSSRNAYLSKRERSIAPQLFTCLKDTKTQILNAASDFDALSRLQIEKLTHLGFNPDYFTICDASTLLPTDKHNRDLVILTAAKLGRTRLIDNIEIPITRPD